MFMQIITQANLPTQLSLKLWDTDIAGQYGRGDATRWAHLTVRSGGYTVLAEEAYGL
jgi:hypothetical protein